MIPFVNDETGLRDYRASLVGHELAARWPWLVWITLLVVAFLVGVIVGGSR